MMPAARTGFEQVIARYPETPGVHYAYGVFLLGEEPDHGIEQLQQELASRADDTWSMLQMAFEYIKRSDYADGGQLGAARRSTAILRISRPARRWVRRCSRPAISAGAIEQLESGGRHRAPTVPALRFQLAKAYQKAGRRADAERERAEFTRLDRLIRRNRAGSQSVGGSESQERPN